MKRRGDVGGNVGPGKASHNGLTWVLNFTLKGMENNRRFLSTGGTCQWVTLSRDCSGLNSLGSKMEGS